MKPGLLTRLQTRLVNNLVIKNSILLRAFCPGTKSLQKVIASMPQGQACHCFANAKLLELSKTKTSKKEQVVKVEGTTKNPLSSNRQSPIEKLNMLYPGEAIPCLVK